MRESEIGDRKALLKTPAEETTGIERMRAVTKALPMGMKKELIEMGLTGMSDLWDTRDKEVKNSLLLKSKVQNFSIVLTVLSPYSFHYT